VISDDELALALATEAGQLLLDLREAMGFDDPVALRAAGDAHSHELLMRRFGSERPDDAVLSEEGADDPARLTADRVWIVDPLDGTREYGEPGRADWAVHVALWVRGPGLTAGAVALPADGDPLATLLHDGRQPTPVSYEGQLRIVVSRTRAPEWVAALAERFSAVTVPMGSAGAKIAAVIRGEAEVYLHSGGQYEWDNAAPMAVAMAAGLRATRIDGTEVPYGRDDPYSPDLLIARPSVHAAVLAALRG
jgi:3'(2'), 5'-bisphosphate nucleotidase